ncbi:MAG: hypothetical protein HWN80_20375 [Candidatus Lokiarchaeota archaeon]|nr:hypothetical protein [Candidatus Lokiarchaeota archaeon]
MKAIEVFTDIYFSNMFEFAKKHLNLTLKEFVELWITPHNSGKFKVRSIEILFFCCNCYDKKIVKLVVN